MVKEVKGSLDNFPVTTFSFAAKDTLQERLEKDTGRNNMIWAAEKAYWNEKSTLLIRMGDDTNDLNNTQLKENFEICLKYE